MRVVSHNGLRLAVHFTKDDIPEGLKFLSEDKDFIQVGTWKYGWRKHLLPHIHNSGTMRTIDRTQEVVHVIEGRLRVTVFSEDERQVDTIIAQTGDTLILLAGGHGYETLADKNIVLEVKNGPYVGPEKDRRRIGLASKEGKKESEESG